MTDCTATQYLDPVDGGWVAVSLTQMRIVLRANEYGCRAEISAEWGNVDRAEVLATVAATMAFLAFPDLREPKEMERAA